MDRSLRNLSVVLSLALFALAAGFSAAQNPVELRVTAPSRMLNDKTLTLKAELFDGSGNIEWQIWRAYGIVSAKRVSDQSPVPTSITYFEEHAGIPAPDSIKFYNGKASVSITLDNGLCEEPGDIEISVTILGLTGSTVVTVLDDTPMRTLSGDISGDLHWSPADGVIHLTGDVGWNSGNLVIDPGTLIMIDPAVDFNIGSNRGITAIGTEEEPIYIFPTTGPPALTLPNVCSSGIPSCEGGTRYNPEAWGQMRHSGSAASVFEQVFFVGGGNANHQGHTRPPMLRFYDSSSFELRDCVLADNPGKAVYGSGNGTYIIDGTLITRCGHGTEFAGGGGYTLRILNSWYAGVGRGPGRDDCGNDCGFDGDLINPRSPGDILIKGCILTDGGDEAIDGSTASITVEDTIIYGVRDRGYTDDNSSAQATFRNCLFFGCGGALGGSGKKILENTTVYGGGYVYGTDNVITKSILWPQTPFCSGTFTHCILGGSDSCGSTNLNTAPLFTLLRWPYPNFNPQPTSPAIDAGPDGDRIGWLGFPTGQACYVDIECDDGNACTIDLCSAGACSNETEVGCVPCVTDDDCVRDPQCAGACTAGICVYGGSCDDGLSCTSNDTCVGGFCVGDDDCPQGTACNHTVDACVLVPTTVIFQQDVDGYTGTQDTYIFQEFPDQSFGDAVLVEWDGWEATSPPGMGMIVGLIRFENIFGTGPGQIPVPGDEINSAVIEYTTFDVGHDGEVREALIDWDEQSTWGGFGADPGPDDDDDYGPILALAPGAPPGGGVTTSTVDVTSSIRTWADNPSANKGWVLIPTGDNGSEFWSSEYPIDTTARPRLVVRYGEKTPLPNVVRQPYLQIATPTRMTIVWETSQPTDSRVSFGTSPGIYDRVAVDETVTTDHQVTLTGLTPDTTYYYEVGSTEQVQAGGCADHYLKTPPPVGSPAQIRIWAFSDSGIHSVHQYRVRDALLDHAGSHQPDLIIHAGDVDQTTPTDDHYTVHHFDVYDEVMNHTVFYPTIGNHDGYTSDSDSQIGPYFDAFVLPTAGEAGGVASGTEAYYSFDYGNVHFVALDSDGTNLEPGSPMLAWLEADLAATDQQWLIAYWHNPPYSFGSHNSNDGSDSGGRGRKMRENFVPVLEAGGVDLVLTGHSHLYERSYLISGAYGYGTDPDYATPDYATLLADGHIIDSGTGRGSDAYVKSPFLSEYEGTVYMTIGTGGSNLDQVPSENHPVMYVTQRPYASALIDIDGNELTFEWIRNDGARMDYFSIIKPCVDNSDCEDGRYCNGSATCNGGNCVAGTAPCSGMLCNEDTDSCVTCLADEDCDDGQFCNGAETCLAGGNCQPGVDPCPAGTECNEEAGLCEQDECILNEDCDDENPCTDDSCSEGACEFSNATGSCDDGDACTDGDVCTAGVCSGTPVVCEDADVCTSDNCVGGVCEYSANGSCHLAGTVLYYREFNGEFEPSAKPVAGVEIDLDGDAVSDAVSDLSGGYAAPDLAGTYIVAPLPRYGDGEPADANGAVSPFDATYIAEYKVGMLELSTNQQLVADASGDGTISSLDAAQVAQLSVGLLQHLPIASAVGSDWLYWRCDVYTSEEENDCTSPLYIHDPLTGPETASFHAGLYGDVTGNWTAPPPAGQAASPGLAPTPEQQAARKDLLKGIRLRASVAHEVQRQRVRSTPATLTLEGWSGPMRAGERRLLFLKLSDADGIEALDLVLGYDPALAEIVEVQAVGLGEQLELATHNDGRTQKVAMYGLLPLQGSGRLLSVTVEARRALSFTPPVQVKAVANEGGIPLEIEVPSPASTKQAVKPDPGRTPKRR